MFIFILIVSKSTRPPDPDELTKLKAMLIKVKVLSNDYLTSYLWHVRTFLNRHASK